MIRCIITYEILTYILNYHLDLWSPLYYLSQYIVKRVKEEVISWVASVINSSLPIIRDTLPLYHSWKNMIYFKGKKIHFINIIPNLKGLTCGKFFQNLGVHFWTSWRLDGQPTLQFLLLWLNQDRKYYIPQISEIWQFLILLIRKH